MNFIRRSPSRRWLPFRLKNFPEKRRCERQRGREREGAEECKFSGNFNSPDYKIDPNSNSHACVTPVANLNLPLWRKRHGKLVTDVRWEEESA